MSEQQQAPAAAPAAETAAAAPAPATRPGENPRARGHSPARDQREAAPVDPERKLKIGSGEYTERQIVDAMAEQAVASAKRHALPADPNGYEVKFRDDFQQPVGIEFQFCDDDGPGLTNAKAFAHRHGLDQAAFSEMLELHAASQMDGLMAQKRFAELEDKKLGERGGERLGSVHQWLSAFAGEKGAAAVMAGIVTARQVEAFEDLMRAFSAQGGSDFNQSHRQQQEEQGKIAGFESMNFVQRRMAQMSMRGPLGGRRGDD